MKTESTIECVSKWFYMYRLNGESFREFHVKLTPVCQIELSFAVFRKIGKMSETAF